MHSDAVLRLHNTREGRCFILGNGPSLLKQVDELAALKDEATFCCNSFGRWKEAPFSPTYYGLTDMHDVEMMNPYIFPHLDMMRFQVGWEEDEHHKEFHWVDKAHGESQVHSNGLVGFGTKDECLCHMSDELPSLPTGRTSPLTLMQIAIWMGYREFYFLGIEQTRGYVNEPDAVMSTTGRMEFPLDKNPKYQIAIQRSFERARKDLESHGGTLIDCTPNGLLNETGQDFYRRGIQWRNILEYKSLADVIKQEVRV